MYTHVTIKGNIGYLILTSKIIQGHQRSKLYIEFIEVKTLKDSQICNFCMHTHMAHRNKIFYFNLTPAVKGGHWSSNIANWGYTIMKTLRCNFCMHTLIASSNIWDGNILKFEVVRGHRSKFLCDKWPQITFGVNWTSYVSGSYMSIHVKNCGPLTWY